MGYINQYQPIDFYDDIMAAGRKVGGLLDPPQAQSMPPIREPMISLSECMQRHGR